MEYKFAVALMNGDDERIMGVFDTKEEADDFGTTNTVPYEFGLQYCFSSLFQNGEPAGRDMRIYNYQVAPDSYLQGKCCYWQAKVEGIWFCGGVSFGMA